MSLVLTIRSGVPIRQTELSAQTASRAAHRPGLPRGAPLSAHVAIIATSFALSDGSSLYCWMPMFFSMYHGGITPACGPMPVRCLMARAHGRTSS